MLKYQTLAKIARQRIVVAGFEQAIDSVAGRPV
jgi:hypothetical protein